MRIVVTGTHGQVASALHERSSVAVVNVIAVGRPKLDLGKPATILPALKALRPDVVVNAAAYTAVDHAEREQEYAFEINAVGAGEIAKAAHTLGVPIIHLSTDYVFDGKKSEPYVETDPISPVSVYGSSKAAGEKLVAKNAENHAILRTSWVYSPFGKNFVRTILEAAKNRKELDIVADQRGSPTSAFDIADGIISVAKTLVKRHPQETAFRGVFHMVAAGDTSWASFGSAIFAVSASSGGPSAAVRYISSADFPQAAKRPANSRLDSSKIANIHGVRLPDWRRSLKLCVERIVRTDERLRAAT